MAYRILFTSRARTDIDDAFGYLAERAPEAASRWYEAVMTQAATLKETPERCAIAPESKKIGVEFRQLLFGRYRFVFEIVEEQKAIRILTVRHGARKPLTDKEVEPFLNDPASKI